VALQNPLDSAQLPENKPDPDIFSELGMPITKELLPRADYK
jgi:hypothetical protein